ncbi:MAG: FtsQ-type POTRA domain-containing protein [Armatimonadota bacterium]|nr:FtsQ-type POTRA domain-containing protein [Armatimonadota bacterium]
MLEERAPHRRRRSGRTRTGRRYAAPRTPRNRRRRRIPAAVWVVSILAVAVTAVGLKDPRFNLQRIEVRGVQVLSEEQVIRHSGLRPGFNLFRAPLAQARERLAQLPPVAAVSLHRRLPNRVLIRVRERQPLACVNVNGVLLTIDDTGLAFRRDATRPPDLPYVESVYGCKMKLGQRLNADTLQVLRECLDACRRVCAPEKARFAIDQIGNVCFNRTGVPYPVRLGSREQLAEKFALLSSLELSMPELRNECEYIDLSCLEAPAWKPKALAVVAKGAGAQQ